MKPSARKAEVKTPCRQYKWPSSGHRAGALAARRGLCGEQKRRRFERLRVGPVQRLIVEAAGDGRLHDVEIRRNIEVARAIERRVADLQNLLERLPAAVSVIFGGSGLRN